MKKPFSEYQDIFQLCKRFGLSENDAEKIKLRASLVIAISNRIERKGYTHAQAANATGFGRTVITSVMNGNIEKISTDRLLDMAFSLGIKITFKIAS